MRLWSIHPEQLDHVALVSVWREGLLAKKVLEGNTKGYKNHPQLDRFKAASDPLASINAYLHAIADEAERRGYNFNRSKLETYIKVEPIPLTNAQLEYEWQHLLSKSKSRTPEHHASASALVVKPHALFIIVTGPIEPWERISLK